MILKPRISGGFPYKRRWEFFAAITGIALGYPLFFATLLIPHYSTAIIYEALPSIIRGIFININDTSIKNPYYPLTFFFIAFIEFPSCLAWLLPGFAIGFYRNKQYYNVEIKNNGWKVFWHGMLFIELTFIAFSIGLVFTFLIQFIPGATLNENFISFFGSGIIMLIFFFISPFMWVGLFLAGLGGYMGTRFAKNRATSSEIVVEEVEAEEVFEEEKKTLVSEDMEETMWPEPKAAKEADDFGINEVNISSLKAKIKSSVEKTETQTSKSFKCPKCNKELPIGAKFCNNCGNKML